MPDHSLFRLRILPWCIALAMSGSYSSVWAEDDIQFDSRFLELKGDTKIDLKRFSSQGYVEPGKYNLQVQLNKQPLAEEYDIYWYAGEDDASKSYACLTPELVAQFGLKEDVAKNLQWSHDAKCLKSGQLEGVEIKADLSQSALVISLPQAYLEYTYPDWDPPSRWDDGISGIVADYSINAQTRHEENGGDDSNEISGNGTVGVNLGPWRMRADWQTNYQHTRSNDDDDEFFEDLNIEDSILKFNPKVNELNRNYEINFNSEADQGRKKAKEEGFEDFCETSAKTKENIMEMFNKFYLIIL